MSGISVHTRRLDQEEMRDFLDWMAGLVPKYNINPSVNEEYIRESGGCLSVGFYPEHDKDAMFAKLKWG